MWGSLGIITLAMAVIGGAIGCAVDTTQTDTSASKCIWQSQPPAESEALVCMNKIKAEEDVTTLEEFVVQMPDNIQPQIERRGRNRYFTWIFGDGSKIVARFRPAGSEGNGKGFVLYMWMMPVGEPYDVKE